MPFVFKLVIYGAPLLLFVVLTYVGVSMLGYPLLPVICVVAIFCLLDFLLLQRMLANTASDVGRDDIG